MIRLIMYLYSLIKMNSRLRISHFYCTYVLIYELVGTLSSRTFLDPAFTYALLSFSNVIAQHSGHAKLHSELRGCPNAVRQRADELCTSALQNEKTPRAGQDIPRSLAELKVRSSFALKSKDVRKCGL